MMQAATYTSLTPIHSKELDDAVELLENPNFASRLADYAGQPVNAIIEHLPGVLNRGLREAVRVAIFKCLELAIGSIDDGDALTTSEWTAKLMTGVAGGVGGFFGMAALPIELPLTTTLMLRSIAEIARAEGEDLRSVEALLACLEVFALGVRGPHDKANVDYYAVRMVLTKLTSEVSALVLERGAVNASSPIVAKLVGEIVARFGLVVSDIAAASAVPIFGAIGGATVNMIFMDHFQRVARGHFTIRRLERLYGVEAISELYRGHARQAASKSGRPHLSSNKSAAR
jgi:hypothetical protein